MAAGVKFYCFALDLGLGKHVFATGARAADTYKVFLTNSTPDVSGDAVYTDLTDLGTAGGYTAGGATAAITSWTGSGGTASLVLADPPLWTATGATIGPFRYAVLYNDTYATKPLICYWDYPGGSTTLQVGETFQVDLPSGATVTVA